VGEVRDLVLAHADEIRALVSAHRGRSVRVFGSVARIEDGPFSDVDLLVEFDHGASIMDQVHLELALRRLLEVDVDVVPIGALKERDSHLLEEAVAL
jgi:predicted nucleotidyltransferase